ncbi:hypothetical protein HPULCUR_003449 [Helicostylum pulchrum]|uniref:Uncharacterized protein n=1 Tax=Helicostylum pulchrum TaxID=562976 RepID=A0ABP9XUS4_9FUNG
MDNTIHRQRKPKPLFGLFRKNKPGPVQVIVPTSPLSSVPLHSILSPRSNIERLPKHSISDTKNPLLSPQFQRRPRSKSVGRDPSAHIRLMEERESALNKLCQREINSPNSSLVDSLPLLSPTYTAPPVPPIPAHHQPMRKFSSAHDLQKAAKIQQNSINQAQCQPLPKRKDLSRSRSLNNTFPQKLQSSKSQQQLKSPISPNPMSRGRWPPSRNHINNNNNNNNNNSSDDDDDIPLGYLQSPISRPSSLLSDNEEEDDEDLIPIARLNTDTSASDVDYQTAADKYKEKVKERLQLDEEDSDDDDIPISLLSSKRFI